MFEVDAGGGRHDGCQKQGNHDEADAQHQHLALLPEGPGLVSGVPGAWVAGAWVAGARVAGARVAGVRVAECDGRDSHRNLPTSCVADALSWLAFRWSAPLKGTNGKGTVRWTVTVTAEPGARQSAGSQRVSILAFSAGWP